MTINKKNKWKRLAEISVTVCLWCLIPLGLAGILLLLAPALVQETEAARRSVCANRLREISQAIRQYRDVFGDWPPVYTVDEQGKPLHSWRVLILPYLNDNANSRFYQEIRLNEPWDSPFNRQFHRKIPPVYRCPSLRTQLNRTNTSQNSTANTTGSSMIFAEKNCSYSAIASGRDFCGADKSLWTPQSDDVSLNIKTANDSDFSNRILIVERKEPVNWMEPDKELGWETAIRGINAVSGGLGSFHPGGMNAAMADGSVRCLAEVIDPRVLQLMILGPAK